MRKKSGSKTGLVIAIVFHVAVIGGLGFLASQQGMLGTKMKELTVVLVPKPRIVDEPKKPVEPKIEPLPTVHNDVPKPAPVVETAPAPKVEAAPAVAPTTVEVPSFSFADGAKNVITTSDPREIYKSSIERYLQAKWSTPETEGLVMVDVQIDQQGNILNTSFLNAHGDNWQGSVGKLFHSVTRLPSAPPNGFPLRFKIRFDLSDQ